MWVAIALNQCSGCAGWPVLGFLHELAAHPTGVIIVATALLFPTTALLYGGITVIFAAKDTVDRWSKARSAKDRAEGFEQGREQERQRIANLMKEYGVQLPPEIARRLNGDGDAE